VLINLWNCEICGRLIDSGVEGPGGGVDCPVCPKCQKALALNVISFRDNIYFRDNITIEEIIDTTRSERMSEEMRPWHCPSCGETLEPGSSGRIPSRCPHHGHIIAHSFTSNSRQTYCMMCGIVVTDGVCKEHGSIQSQLDDMKRRLNEEKALLFADTYGCRGFLGGVDGGCRDADPDEGRAPAHVVLLPPANAFVGTGGEKLVRIDGVLYWCEEATGSYHRLTISDTLETRIEAAETKYAVQHGDVCSRVLSLSNRLDTALGKLGALEETSKASRAELQGLREQSTNDSKLLGRLLGDVERVEEAMESMKDSPPSEEGTQQLLDDVAALRNVHKELRRDIDALDGLEDLRSDVVELSDVVEKTLRRVSGIQSVSDEARDVSKRQYDLVSGHNGLITRITRMEEAVESRTRTVPEEGD